MEDNLLGSLSGKERKVSGSLSWTRTLLWVTESSLVHFLESFQDKVGVGATRKFQRKVSM